MNQATSFERRIAVMIAEYANRAPTDVDPLAMAQLAAASTGAAAFPFVPSRLRMGAAAVVIALVGALVGGAIVGGSRLFERDRDPILIEGVRDGPFIGLPPAGAAPSRPEIGKLVLEASGRCTPEGGFCYVWIYADGRLVWLRDWASPFGANEGSTGLVEQHLAPSGVEHLVSAFRATGRCREADRAPLIACNAHMPGPAPFPAITDPGWIDPSWGMAASAWEDPAIWGYVPSTVGACFAPSTVSASSDASSQRIEPSRVLELLPPRAADRLRGQDTEFPPVMEGWPDWPDPPMTCFRVSTDEARAVSDILSTAGLERDEHMAAYLLGYHLGAAPPFEDALIWFGTILPHGNWFVSGGG